MRKNRDGKVLIDNVLKEDIAFADGFDVLKNEEVAFFDVASSENGRVLLEVEILSKIVYVCII